MLVIADTYSAIYKVERPAMASKSSFLGISFYSITIIEFLANGRLVS